MQIPIRYEPCSQRSYKLGIMIIGHIYRVFTGLQGTFCEYHNAFDHDVTHSVLFLWHVLSASGNGSSERLSNSFKFTQLQRRD